ncbi:hypothetical protein KY362_02510 [Candidatus Woesearchaeota archaeon]|nr:hypothetical protein [Candidatus Woesearchaeota archaeon]
MVIKCHACRKPVEKHHKLSMVMHHGVPRVKCYHHGCRPSGAHTKLHEHKIDTYLKCMIGSELFFLVMLVWFLLAYTQYWWITALASFFILIYIFVGFRNIMILRKVKKSRS